MTDPKPGLKLPLRVVPSLDFSLYLYVQDGHGHPVKLTEHQLEVIVAALTADAEEEAG